MVKKNNMQRMIRGAVLLALALIVAIPFAALAEASAAKPAAATYNTAGMAAPGQFLGRGRQGSMPGGYGTDTGSLTDEQKAAYLSALALYETIEDAVLKDLVAASVVTQADVDAYAALRDAQKSLDELDQASWTAQQYKAFYEANAKTGDERMAAMQALADAGQLTKAQADALGAQGQSGLWAKIAQNASTNSAIQTAVSTLMQARQQLNSTLRGAGITGTGRGVLFGCFGDGAMEFGQGANQNGNSGRPQDGRGGRRN